jgi:mRNA interferase HigB
VRIIGESALKNWARIYPDAASWLRNWTKIAGGARWSSIRDVRTSYPHADGAAVKSGKVATIFNVAGNRYRMITAIHYNREIIFVMMFLTHAEYSKGLWKDRL